MVLLQCLKLLFTKRYDQEFQRQCQWKKLYNQPIATDIKQYEEIRRLTTGQGEDYTTGCLLDYESIKNHYALIAVNLSRQKGNSANRICWTIKKTR